MELLLPKYTLLFITIVVLNLSTCKASYSPNKALAEWTVLSYIQADNDLAHLADCQIVNMQQGMLASEKVNMLVQLDRPKSNVTWRFRIVPGGKVDDGSFNGGMGYHPEDELVDAMQWIKEKYPAKHYALILSNHGTGIEDLKSIPGLDRGILYDYSQNSLLTNPALSSALGRIKIILGQEIDVLGMDACLMAMLEVAYQVKDYARYFVGSQESEPGEGWAYAPFLRSLSASPANTTPLQLAHNMVAAFKDCYAKRPDATDFTQSAINLNRIEAVKQNIDQLVANIVACNSLDGATTRSMVLAARKACIEFTMPQYIDLYSLYTALHRQILLLVPRAAKSDTVIAQICKKDKKYVSPEYVSALGVLKNTILDGMSKIAMAVSANVSGPQYPGVQGMSIYYPRNGQIHESYFQTMFAQDAEWTEFIQHFR